MAVIIQPNAAFMLVKPRKEKQYREMNLNMDNYQLHQRYRFRQDSIDFLVNLLAEDLMRDTNRNYGLSVETQVLVSLRFLASGSFLQVIGDTVGLDKSTVSRCVFKVCEALVNKRDRFILWPNDDDLKTKIKKGFYELGRFPNVVGCIDGTHIRIQAPASTDEKGYVNRKGWHSINVQAVCDHEGKITNICANWPGSTHDSHIFRTSNLNQYLSDTHTNLSDGLILGDSGYPCRPFLITPYLNPVGRPQEKLNKALCSTRVTIERTFGRLKRRFHVLHSEIRMSPDRVCKIVIACAVLHNIAIIRQDELHDDVDINGQTQPELDDYRGRNDGRGIRDHIANSFFNN